MGEEAAMPVEMLDATTPDHAGPVTTRQQGSNIIPRRLAGMNEHEIA